jgi:hypothetical protein
MMRAPHLRGTVGPSLDFRIFRLLKIFRSWKIFTTESKGIQRFTGGELVSAQTITSTCACQPLALAPANFEILQLQQSMYKRDGRVLEVHMFCALSSPSETSGISGKGCIATLDRGGENSRVDLLLFVVVWICQ